MKFSTRLALAALLAAALPASALAQQGEAPTAPSTPAAPSALDASLFYQLLLGELSVQGSEPGAGFSLILDAARKTNDPALYQRAVEIAFQARSGESALQAARAWKQAYPKSREANRYVLQVLLVLNRVADTAEPLKTDIALAEPAERNAAIGAIPRAYGRAADKKVAAALVEQALSGQLADRTYGAAAWTTVGRMRLAAEDGPGAVEAARRGQALAPQAEGPVLLALELMDAKQPQAEALVRQYLAQGKPLAELRMGYARTLLDAQRYAEALEQLQVVTTERPDFPEAWLVQGTLLVQDNQLDKGEAALKRYVELAQQQRSGEERSRGLAQAYLSLSQIAEKRKDYPLAGAWLDKIENSQDLLAAQSRRASLMARQGKLDDARKLIRALPERNPGDARAKLMAEVSLLREFKQYKPAYELLDAAAKKDPADPDLIYDQAMMAEKLNDLPDMERLLRQLIAAKPDYHHAYNALGYSFAERSVRLPEAKQLIQKALEFAPNDPFISDSLAWVEFRMGNKAEAVRILEAAYKSRPDAEIAAHLGEVLWSMGERDRAQTVWREGMLLNNESETLQETLKRLKVRP
ncbi:MAG: tetratricopeptide repeat protein [Pseudomonadota bacterium]